MLNEPQHDRNAVGFAESRAHPRLQVHSLAYIELTDDNAGLILNISETGIAVQAVQVLSSERFPHMRFRLPRTENLIEADGRLVWQIRSKKEAGIEFVGLPEKTRAQIRTWIASEREQVPSPASPQWDGRRQNSAAPAQETQHPAGIPPDKVPSSSHKGVAKPAPAGPAPVGRTEPETSPGGLNDWVSQKPHAASGDDRRAAAPPVQPVPPAPRAQSAPRISPAPSVQPPSSVQPDSRVSRFHLPPLHPRFPVEPEDGNIPGPQDSNGADRVPAMPRWNGYMAPGVGMELRKPRRWWTYTAALGFIAALGFAALMMFNPDTITRARIDALTRMRGTTADNAQSSGQGDQANNLQQQNRRSGEDTAQNPQAPPSDSDGQFPLPNDTGSNLAAPSASASTSSAENGSVPAKSDRSGQPAPVKPPSAKTSRTTRNRVQQPTRAYNPPSNATHQAYGRSAVPSGTDRTQPSYQTQYRSPDQSATDSSSAARQATPYQPAPQATPQYSSNTSGSTTSSQAGNGTQQQAPANTYNNPARPPGSPASGTATSQNPPAQAPSTNTRNLQTQQTGGARPGNEDVMQAWRAQTTASSASRPGANPAGSATTANPQPAAPRDQDLYARRSTMGEASSKPAAVSSKPAAGTSSQPSVEVSGVRTPVPPSVPLSGVPSGSVGATSQFHGFIPPPELQSKGSQLVGQLRIGQLISSYSPVYPIEAAREGIEGTVQLDVTVGRDGTVKSVRVISGPAMLTSAAAAAARDWRYEETFVAGQPVEAREYVTVVFRLAAK